MTEKKSPEEAYLDSCLGMNPDDILSVLHQELSRLCSRFGEDDETGGTRAIIKKDESEETFSVMLGGAPEDPEEAAKSLEGYRKEFSRLARIAKLLGERVVGTPEGSVEFLSKLSKFVGEVFGYLIHVVTSQEIQDKKVKRKEKGNHFLSIGSGHFSAGSDLGLDFTQAPQGNPNLYLKALAPLITTDKLLLHKGDEAELKGLTCLHDEYMEHGCLEVIAEILKHNSPLDMDRLEDDLATVCPLLRPYVRGMNAFLSGLVEEEVSSLPMDDPFTFILTTRPMWVAMENIETLRCRLACNVGLIINPSVSGIMRITNDLMREMVEVISSMITTRVGASVFLDDMPAFLRFRSLVEGLAEITSFSVTFETVRRCFLLADEILDRYEEVIDSILTIHDDWEELQRSLDSDEGLEEEEVKELVTRLKGLDLSPLEHSGLFRYDGPAAAKNALVAARKALAVIHQGEDEYEQAYLHPAQEDGAGEPEPS